MMIMVMMMMMMMIMIMMMIGDMQGQHLLNRTGDVFCTNFLVNTNNTSLI